MNGRLATLPGVYAPIGSTPEFMRFPNTAENTVARALEPATAGFVATGPSGAVLTASRYAPKGVYSMQIEQPKSDVREQPLDAEAEQATDDESREMPCPVCGAAMPDLKGGKASICQVCGFKDSCCY